AALRACFAHEIPVEPFYARLRERGLDQGPSFRGVSALWSRAGESLGRVAFPNLTNGDLTQYSFHPAVADSCLQSALAADSGAGADGRLYLPIAFDTLRIPRPASLPLWTHAIVPAGEPSGRDTLRLDARLIDESGLQVAELEGLTFRRVTREAFEAELGGSWKEHVYEVAWEGAERVASEAPAERVRSRAGAGAGAWLMFADRGGVGERLAERVRREGGRCVLVKETAGGKEEYGRLLEGAAGDRGLRSAAS